MESSGTKPIAEVPKLRNQKGEWENSRAEADQLQFHSSKPTTQTTKQKKHTQTQLPQNPQNSKKKKGGSQEAVSKLIQALRSSSLTSQTQKPYPEAESTIINFTHHHHQLLGCHTKHQKHKRIKSKSKCSSWELLNKSVGIPSISS
jgi:hypothetical protein